MPSTIHRPPDCADALDSALDTLSPQQRRVVELVYFSDLDQSTAAAQLGITKGAVSRHLDRAKRKLRLALTTPIGGARAKQ